MAWKRLRHEWMPAHRIIAYWSILLKWRRHNFREGYEYEITNSEYFWDVLDSKDVQLEIAPLFKGTSIVFIKAFVQEYFDFVFGALDGEPLWKLINALLANHPLERLGIKQAKIILQQSTIWGNWSHSETPGIAFALTKRIVNELGDKINNDVEAWISPPDYWDTYMNWSASPLYYAAIHNSYETLLLLIDKVPLFFKRDFERDDAFEELIFFILGWHEDTRTIKIMLPYFRALPDFRKRLSGVLTEARYLDGVLRGCDGLPAAPCVEEFFLRLNSKWQVIREAWILHRIIFYWFEPVARRLYGPMSASHSQERDEWSRL